MTERERALLLGKKINPLTANESALAYAVAHGGGSTPTYGSDEYETGTWQEASGAPGFYMTIIEHPTSIEWRSHAENGETIYFNSIDYPLTKGNDVSWVFNLRINEGGPEIIDETKPAFVVQSNGEAIALMSTEDLSNTTVSILWEIDENAPIVIDVSAEGSGVEWDEEEGKYVADDTFNGLPIYYALKNDKRVELLAPLMMTIGGEEFEVEIHQAVGGWGEIEDTETEKITVYVEAWDADLIFKIDASSVDLDRANPLPTINPVGIVLPAKPTI